MSSTLANANALFQGLKRQPSFHKVIAVIDGDDEDSLLRGARSKIRHAIRSRFRQFEQLIRKKSREDRLLLEDRGPSFREKLRNSPLTEVRFLTQGSYAYELLVRPAQVGQEIDLDDGVYVPMPFIDGRPIVSSAGLFDLIEEAIAELVESEIGWSQERRPTCIRVSIGPGAHIDLPLYAIETSEYESVRQFLEERAAGQTFVIRKFDMEVASQFGRRANVNKILLACGNDWRPSDPKKFGDWFQSQLDVYGPVLRRIIRYLKAWRDKDWFDGKLKSMALMILCARAFEEMDSRPGDQRDDILALEVARRLPDLIAGGDIRWSDDCEALDETWTPSDRNEIVEAAKRLHDSINDALVLSGHPELTVKHLRSAFGERFPNAPEAVEIGERAKIQAMRVASPAVVPQRSVGTSTSG